MSGPISLVEIEMKTLRAKWSQLHAGLIFELDLTNAPSGDVVTTGVSPPSDLKSVQEEKYFQSLAAAQVPPPRQLQTSAPVL